LFSTNVHEFKDLGRSYGRTNTEKALRWEFTYDGLDETQAAILDSHYASASGIFEGFQFRHPRTDVLYSDVHYESYDEPTHVKRDTNARKLVLIKSPV